MEGIGGDGKPGKPARAVESAPPTALTPPPGGGAPVPGSESTLAPGTLLARRYSIVRFLARGGMGEVYEARDTELGVAVALKTIRPLLAHGPSVLERFKREIVLARGLSHPNLCRTFEFGREERSSPPIVFLTMELLAGETLSARIRREGRLAAPVALALLRQMASALDHAHAAGVVHRDLKSANVFLVPGPSGERAVITDFGLAREIAPADSHGITHDGALLGTPAYMAPEQVRGETAGPAALHHA